MIKKYLHIASVTLKQSVKTSCTSKSVLYSNKNYRPNT